MTDSEIIGWVVGGLVVLSSIAGTVYWCVNVSYGPEQETPGVVVAKRHEGGTVHTSIDADGKVSMHTDPDEYLVEVSTQLGGCEFDSYSLYSSVVTSDRVQVRYRQRYWKGVADRLVFEGARR